MQSFAFIPLQEEDIFKGEIISMILFFRKLRNILKAIQLIFNDKSGMMSRISPSHPNYWEKSVFVSRTLSKGKYLQCQSTATITWSLQTARYCFYRKRLGRVTRITPPLLQRLLRNDLLRPILIFAAAKKNGSACSGRRGSDFPRPILIFVAAK